MKALIIIFIAIALVIVSLGRYLSPDDLKHCGDMPSAKPGCQKVDAIVAISGGDTKARTNEAIKLYQNGWANVLVFSGAAQDKSGPSNAAVMRQRAENAGVPDSAIIIDENSETTQQNAENSQSIFEQNDIASVILVTSAYHERRAELEFNKRAKGTVTVLSHPVASDDQWSAHWWWLTPTGWWLALSELAKILAFYLSGGNG